MVVSSKLFIHHRGGHLVLLHLDQLDAGRLTSRPASPQAATLEAELFMLLRRPKP